MRRNWTCVPLAVLMMSILAGHVAAAPPAESQPLECMKRFKFKEFPVGAWWSVSGDEAEVKLYADCGFNIDLQSCRYEVRKDDQLRLAEQYGLKVMIDTCICWPPPRENPHWATLNELKWLEKNYGDHPAVIGFLINDNCHLDARTQAIAQYLRENAPELIAWVSTNPQPDLQAKLADSFPILTSQNYPFLWQGKAPDGQKRIAFCNRLQKDREHANRNNMCLWPFVASQLGRPRDMDPAKDQRRVSDSQMRFQVYTSIAYGAQGLPYFMYWHALANAAGPTDLYPVVQECNRYVTGVLGPRVLGHRCIGVYHSGDEQPNGAWKPADGELIESMSDMTLAGVLVPESQFVTGENTPDYLMVVDKRTVKSHEEEPEPREITIRFSPGVKKVEEMLPSGRARTHDLTENREITLSPLRAGEGILLYTEVAEHGFKRRDAPEAAEGQERE